MSWIGNKYNILSTISTTRKSTVYLGKDIHDQRVVIKAVPFEDSTIDNEIQIMSFLTKYDDLDYYQSLIETIGDTTHRYLITRHIPIPFTQWINYHSDLPHHPLYMMVDLAEALLYLHHSGIAHCDLKPENIMLQRDSAYDEIPLFRPVLIDFGYGCFATSMTPIKVRGTAAYMAPELWTQSVQDVRSVDVFALGCL